MLALACGKFSLWSWFSACSSFFKIRLIVTWRLDSDYLYQTFSEFRYCRRKVRQASIFWLKLHFICLYSIQIWFHALSFYSPELNSKMCSLQTPLVSEGEQNRWLSCSTTAPALNAQFCKSFFNPFRVTYFWYFGYFSSIFLLQQSEVWGYSLKWNELWNDRQ